MTGCVGWLVTECKDVRAMLTRETCPGQGGCSMRVCRARRAPWAGVRAPIVAKKRGNARGAKGCRKADVRDACARGFQPRECPSGLSRWESDSVPLHMKNAHTGSSSMESEGSQRIDWPRTSVLMDSLPSGRLADVPFVCLSCFFQSS